MDCKKECRVESDFPISIVNSKKSESLLLKIRVRDIELSDSEFFTSFHQ